MLPHHHVNDDVMKKAVILSADKNDSQKLSGIVL